MGVILVENLEVVGTHGVLAEEKDRPQPFRVDLELTVDLTAAGASDALSDTVDYGALSERVAGVVSNESYELLERLATRIGEECFADARVERVVVTLRKLRPPVPLHLAAVGVRLDLVR